MHCLPNTSVYNLFGPTETNVCLYHKVPAAPDESAHQVPIGKPCQHLTVELLDDGAHSLSPSIEGEICVAGPSVLSEYFRRPQETALAFYPAQQFADGRARYRTGDRASVDESGLYWFHGRHDRLVKRRGFRVELGEIEAAICTEPSVREAAAYVRRSEADTRIHVAVVLHATRVLSPLSLRAHCGKLLPAYMVPDVVELVSDLPRTPNGKVDLQRLSAPSAV
jgi:acyl-coenzyme A synthetase/AMP-(fatty) acid ligase